MTALSEEAQASSERVSRRIDHLQDANVAINATLVQHGQMIEQNGQLLRQILAAVNNPPQRQQQLLLRNKVSRRVAVNLSQRCRDPKKCFYVF